MLNSRKNLFSRVSALESALNVEALFSKAPTYEKENQTARLLRNGLSVVAFGILEDFIRTRTSEILEKISNHSTSFSKLPDRIQEASVVGAFNAMRFQLSLIDKIEDQVKFIQNESQLIHSTQTSNYQISQYSFIADKPNLQSSDIEKTLFAFGVDKPWNSIGGIASLTGLLSLDLKQQFEDSLKKRNFSAHDANTDTEITYLNSLLNTIVAICLGYDILISESIKLIKQLKTKEINDRKITHKQIKFRFIEKNDEFWREIIKGGKRAITKNKDFQIVFDSAIVRSSKNAEVLIEKNSKGSPVKWFTPFVD